MDKSLIVSNPPKTITLSTKAKRRMRTTREEAEVLERFYAENTNPTNEQKAKIAELVQMGPKSVHFWFQNRRAKDNKKKKIIQMQSDNKTIHSCPPSSFQDIQSDCKESYERLLEQQRQLEELKRAQYQRAAAQLPPISALFGQKKSQKEQVGLDIPFVFHHAIYGIEAYAEQMARSNKNMA